MHVIFILLVMAILAAIAATAYTVYRYRRHRELTSLRDTVILVQTPDHTETQRRRVYAMHTERAAILDPDMAMLYTARLYIRGIHGLWRPDVETGHRLCRELVLNGTDSETRTEAMTLLYDTPEIEDTQSPVLPGDMADQCLRRYYRDTHTTRATRFHRAAATPPQPPPAPIPPIPRPPKAAVHDDPQSSHQHTVVATSRTALHALDDVNDGDIISRIESYIQRDTDPLMTDETRAKALHALDSINTIESTQFPGLTERQALARVWNRVDASERDQVIHQLADSIEHGMPVCHTGKMTRLASVVDTVLPTWQVKELFQSEAARIREDTLKNASATETREYMESDDSRLKDAMLASFNTYATDFMARHELSPSVMSPMVDEVVAGF
jgi:hypothetical protein